MNYNEYTKIFREELTKYMKESNHQAISDMKFGDLFVILNQVEQRCFLIKNNFIAG